MAKKNLRTACWDVYRRAAAIAENNAEIAKTKNKMKSLTPLHRRRHWRPDERL